MKKILFVCAGNTCRSPMAEYIMKNLAEKAGLGEEIAVASAGCKADVGRDMTDSAKEVLEQHGIPLGTHRSRQLVAADYDNYDFIIGLDRGNVINIIDIVGGDKKGKVKLLMEFAKESRDVNDPFATEDYEATFQDIKWGCKAIMTDMNTPEKKNPKKLAVFLLDALMDTDASHTKTTAMLQEEIRNRWKEISGKDDTLSEKTIQNHIKDWNESELYSIKSNKGGNNRGYYMDEFPIEATDISLIAQSMFRASNASLKSTKSLFEALKRFTDVNGREYLKQMINQLGRTTLRRKTENNQILYAMDDLLKAIISQKQVTFNYYTRNKENLVLIADSKTNKPLEYKVSPYYMVWENDECYLICHYPGNDTKAGRILSHFRLSHITNVKKLDEDTLSIGNMVEFYRYARPYTINGNDEWLPSQMKDGRKKGNRQFWLNTEENHKRMAAGEPPIMPKIEALKLFALDRYARENVYMYHNDAPPADIKLFFREDSLETVISQFGLDEDRIECNRVTSYFTDGEQVCTATVTAQPNEGLYQWLLQHSNHVIAVKPDYVREEVHRRLKTALMGIESYEDGTEDIDEYAKSSRLAHDVMMQHRMGVDMRIIKFE